MLQVGELSDGSSDINELEEMLFHFSKLLHPNHYILVDIMHNLVHLYAAKKVLTRPEKERKIQLCGTVMETLSKVDPGYTKWRGSLLQELIHPLMLISKEDHNAERITTREFEKRLAFCTRRLETAKKCLRGGFTSVEDFIRQQQQLRLASNAKANAAAAAPGSASASASLSSSAQPPETGKSQLPNGVCKAKILEIAVKLKNKKAAQESQAAAKAEANLCPTSLPAEE